MTVLTLTYAFTGSVLAPMLASLMGGDDEYWKLSDWDRQNNLCVFTGNGFIKIPLPHELRVFHGFGDNMAQAIMGKKDGGDAFLDALSNFTDLIPVDPAGAATATWSDYKGKGFGKSVGTFGAVMSPDMIKPFTQLAANRNFMGGQIYKENQKPYRPGWTKVRTNKKGEAYVPDWIVDFANATDNFTGGDGVEAGLISLNPDVIQHFAKGYTGGLYTLFSSAVDMAYKVSSGKNIEIRDTPIKQFFTAVSDTEKMNQGLNSKYYNITKEVETNLSKINDYKKEVGKGNLSVLEFNNKLQDLNYEKAKSLDKKIKAIDRLNKRLPKLDGDEQKRVEDDIFRLKEEVIEMSGGR
jgi:hypothetical protein